MLCTQNTGLDDGQSVSSAVRREHFSFDNRLPAAIGLKTSFLSSVEPVMILARKVSVQLPLHKVPERSHTYHRMLRVRLRTLSPTALAQQHIRRCKLLDDPAHAIQTVYRVITHKTTQPAVYGVESYRAAILLDHYEYDHRRDTRNSEMTRCT